MEAATSGARRALPLLVVSIVAKPIGFLREVVVAAAYGSGTARDAFLVAWQIPNTIGSFVMEGLPQVLVPYLTELRGKPHHDRVLGGLLLLALGTLLLLAALVALAAGPLVGLVAPFAPAETRSTATTLLRLLAPSVLFLGMTAVFTALLYARERLTLPALAAPITNLVIMAAVWAAHGELGIHALALGVLAGSAVALALLYVPLRGLPALSGRIVQAEHRALWTMASSFLLGTALFNVNAVLEKVFASTLPAGGLSNLDYAFRIAQMAFTLFALVPLFYYPRLCAHALTGSGDYAALVERGTKITLITSLPAAGVLWALREPLVSLAYQRGAFDPAAARATADLLGVYAAGLAPHCLVAMLIHAFYARRAMRTRVAYAALFLAVNVGMNALLIRSCGAAALAWGNGAGAAASAAFLWLRLGRTSPAALRGCGATLLKSLVLGGAVAAVTSSLWRWLPGDMLPRLGVALAAAVLVFLGTAAVLRLEERKHLWELVRAAGAAWRLP